MVSPRTVNPVLNAVVGSSPTWPTKYKPLVFRKSIGGIDFVSIMRVILIIGIILTKGYGKTNRRI